MLCRWFILFRYIFEILISLFNIMFFCSRYCESLDDRWRRFHFHWRCLLLLAWVFIVIWNVTSKTAISYIWHMQTEAHRPYWRCSAAACASVFCTSICSAVAARSVSICRRFACGMRGWGRGMCMGYEYVRWRDWPCGFPRVLLIVSRVLRQADLSPAHMLCQSCGSR